MAVNRKYCPDDGKIICLRLMAIFFLSRYKAIPMTMAKRLAA